MSPFLTRRCPHSWSLTPTEAVALQRRLADRVVPHGRRRSFRLVAGADLAFERDRAVCIAGVVVWDATGREVVEQQVARAELTFPYVPGLLSFREAPALLAALRKIRCEPDLFMFDGQGFAHPRRFGLACHVGVILDRPSIGVAKSVLVGVCDEPGRRRGAHTAMIDHGERIGEAVRTRDRVRLVYVSIGHHISLDVAVEAVLACGTRYRLPEPTRLADHLVSRERG